MKLLKSTKLKTLFFILISVISFAQKSGIQGRVVDEQKRPLEMVSVAVLSPKDSIFLSYTTTDVKGNFSLVDVPKDTILIQFNLLGFKSFSKKVFYNNSLIDLNTITLKEDISSLDEIVIAAVVPIQIKKEVKNNKTHRKESNGSQEDLHSTHSNLQAK